MIIGFHAQKTSIGFGVIVFVTFTIILLFSSCGRPYTYVSGVSFYPTNSTWETALYALEIKSDGEPGKSYSEMSDKQVHLTISRRGKVLLQKKYLLKAADLGCKVHWPEAQSLQIIFSDAANATNIIRTMSFKISDASDQVIETTAN